MSSEIIELEYYDRINEVSSKLKDATLQAYINLHGVFAGLHRLSGREVSSIYKILAREKNKCYLHRVSLRRGSEWDEILLIVCSNIIIASQGYVENNEVFGKELLEKIINNINSGKYIHCILETIEIPVKLIEERMGVDLKSIIVEREKPEVKPVEEKPSLRTEQKPSELERIVEETLAPETVATIPIETSVSRTETIPEEKVIESKDIETIFLEKPIVETTTKKPVVLEEITNLDKPILEFSDKLMGLSDRESIGLTNVVIYGDQDRLEVEVVVSKIGWGKKREKMLKLVESIANIFSNILMKYNAPQKELTITVRHGLNAVRISKKLK